MSSSFVYQNLSKLVEICLIFTDKAHSEQCFCLAVYNHNTGTRAKLCAKDRNAASNQSTITWNINEDNRRTLRLILHRAKSPLLQNRSTVYDNI